MELQDPRAIRLGGAQLTLLEQVVEAGAKIASQRPFSPDVTHRLRQALLPDRIVASLNMEGITATRRVTLQIMDLMRLEETASRAEREVLNLLRADDFLNQTVEDGVPLDPGLVRQTQRHVLDGIHSNAGAYRQGSIELPGAPFRPPSASDVGPLMEGICDRFGQAEGLHPIVQAGWLHAQFTMVHPFDDGNGRTGRLLQDWSLMRRGMFPTGISSAMKDDYYEALEEADQARWGDLVEMLATLQLSVMAKVEAVIREPQERTAWVSRLAKAAAARYRDTRHKKYLVWRQRTENLGREFEAAAEELDATSNVVGVTFKTYPGLEFAHWLEVADQGSFTRTWQFGLLFFAERKAVWKGVFYARRHQWVPCDPFQIPAGTVALYVAGQAADAAERLDILHFDDPHITLRELVYVDDDLLRYRLNEEGELECDVDTSPTEAVRDFFLDVFGRKLGLEIM